MDRREAILARIFTALATVTGVETCVRNRGLLQQDNRPAIVLLDGPEAEVRSPLGRGRGSMVPSLMVLRPQIFILLKSKKPRNELVGEELNSFRIAVLKALDADAELPALLTSNGEFAYHGCLTDLQTGSTVEGQMQLQMSFVYPFIPSEL